MKRKVILGICSLLLFATGIGGGIIIRDQAVTALTKQKYVLEKRIAELENAASRQKEQTATELFTNKTAELQDVVKGKLSFVSSVKKSGTDTYQVTIKLQGESRMKTDAADLVLAYGPDLEISDVTVGTAFPSYPRKTIGPASVTITGLATVAGTDMSFGKPDAVFAVLTVKKLTPEKQARLILDTNNTNVYLMGESVMDYNASFMAIEL